MRMPRTTPASALLVAFAWAAGCTEPTDSRALAAASWIAAAEVPLASVTPVESRTDLAAFTAMVGSARLIGLGEATHGSREFFTMKDRLVRHLVQDAGVTGFAIEATMPEAFAIDTYVRTGVGNPAVLLSHLYFWTWNTQEVLDLIAWLREWNQQHPDRQVGFYGFDMQYPGVAMDSVTSYVERVMPSLSSTLALDYSCMADYRNNTRGIFAKKYSAASSPTGECRTGMNAAYSLLLQHQGELIAASSDREFQLAVRMARVVIQWEAVTLSPNGGPLRDEMMAENIGWLLEREGAGGRLVLWAHDYHISRYIKTMGVFLDAAYGDDYLPVGFAFGSGGLNAVEGLGAGAFGSLKSFEAPAPVSGSYEATLAGVDDPNFYLDLRQSTGDARAWLLGPRPHRNVGSVYFPQNPGAHYLNLSLLNLYDVLIFVRTTTPSTLLKFQF